MDNNMSHIAEECIRFTKNDIITEMVEDFIGKVKYPIPHT